MPKQVCLTHTCKRRSWLAGYCKTHATRVADKMFSNHIKERDGACLGKSPGFWLGPDFACYTGQGLHCAHLWSRGIRILRWDVRNAVTLCASHHKWIDDNELAKDDMRLNWWGRRQYNMIKKKGRDTNWRPELEKVLTKGFVLGTPQ